MITCTLQVADVQPLNSYGNFIRFPREIRDQIYAEYFAVDTSPSLEQYLDNSESKITLYVCKSDKGLMRVSRALYKETHPLWEKYCLGRNLFRVATGISIRDLLNYEPMFLTLSAETVSKFTLSSTQGMHITWLSSRWSHNPGLPRAGGNRPRVGGNRPRAGGNRPRVGGNTRRARLVFPNLKSLIPNTNGIMELDQSIALFEKVLVGCSWRISGRLNIFIADATWPILQPGEKVWYHRLHQGWTRRSLMNMRASHLETITNQLGDIIYRLRKFFNKVTFTFGAMRGGRYTNSSALEGKRIVTALQHKIPGLGISIEYL